MSYPPQYGSSNGNSSPQNQPPVPSPPGNGYPGVPQSPTGSGGHSWQPAQPGQPGSPQPGGAFPPPQPPKKPKVGLFVGIVCAVLAVLALVVVIVGVAIYVFADRGSSDGPVDPTPSPTDIGEETTSEDPSEDVDVSPTEDDIAVGETEVVVDSMEDVSSYDNISGETIEPNNGKFIHAGLSITNNGDQPLDLDPNNFTITDQDGNDITATTSVLTGAAAVRPGETGMVDIYWDVSEETTPTDMVLVFGSDTISFTVS